MKKLFIIVSIVFSIFLVSDNVSAMTYQRFDEEVQINDDNIVYYVYSVKPEIFNYNSISIIYSSQYNLYQVFYNNDTHDWQLNSSNFSSFPISKPNLTGYLGSISSNVSINRFNVNLSSNSYNDSSSVNASSNVPYADKLVFACGLESGDINYPSFLSSSCSLTKQDMITYWTNVPTYYTITYYLNNEVYREIEVEEGTSHTLIYYEPDSTYNFSGWDYGNANLTNIQSDITITGTTTLKPYYTISYYLNSEIYNSVSVIEGTNYSLVDYVPPKNYQFSGWSYDSNIDLTNITQNVNIFGTSVYVRPQMTYNEESDSIIHNLSYEILGNDVPVEFDYVYTLVDYLILLILVFCALVPFIIVFKLLNF